MANKVFIVTGASSGIGEGLAVHLASIGCQGLTLCGRDKTKLDQVVEKCIQAAPKSTFLADERLLVMPGDVRDADYIKNMVSETAKKFGRIDILVNNAGTGQDCTLSECDMSLYDLQFDCHVRSVVMTTYNALSYLRRTKGSVVNVSSISALTPMRGELFYAMSKSALDSFTKCAAIELGKDGIRVNSVNLGVTRTNFHYNVGFSTERFEQYLGYEDVVTPLGRHAEVDDVIPVIMFLTSDDARYVTGVCLPVDGGRTCVVSKFPGTQTITSSE